MEELQVVCVKEDKTGEITHIGGYWGEDGEMCIVSKDDAIDQLIDGEVEYYVVHQGKYAEVVPYDDDTHLRTKKDGVIGNNLSSLPLC